jgi:predicted Rossmann-fold nucleotide-binding protein
VVELLSWRRLGLHAKPTVFYNPNGFGDPLFGFFDRTVIQNLTPPAFASAWRAVDEVEAILPAIREMADSEPETVPRLMPKDRSQSSGRGS